MLGQKQIIAARLKGFKPSAIFVRAGLTTAEPRFAFEDPERALEHKLFPTVLVDKKEMSTRLDLRFLAGCRVHVHGDALTDEMIGFAEAVASAGAKHIILCCLDGSELMEFKNNEWTAYL